MKWKQNKKIVWPLLVLWLTNSRYFSGHFFLFSFNLFQEYFSFCMSAIYQIKHYVVISSSNLKKLMDFSISWHSQRKLKLLMCHFIVCEDSKWNLNKIQNERATRKKKFVCKKGKWSGWEQISTSKSMFYNVNMSFHSSINGKRCSYEIEMKIPGNSLLKLTIISVNIEF